MEIVLEVRRQLKASANKQTKDSFQRFFKEKVKCYGVKSHLVAKVARSNYLKISSLGKLTIFDYCEQLLKSGFCEEAFVAANWAYEVRSQFKPNDVKIFEHWIDKYIDNWAECDTLCNHAVGAFIQSYPKYMKKIKKWAESDNRWLKRASAVTLIIPAKEGQFLTDIFEIAEKLLLDSDDMVQKGYGWLLKEASRKHQQEVFDFVIRYKDVMPRTALRYAIEKMPPQLRQKAMQK